MGVFVRSKIAHTHAHARGRKTTTHDRPTPTRDVLAKRGRYPSVVETAFRAAFPTVLRIIRAVNRDDHGELIRLLQRAESWLVIEQVAPRLLGRVRIVTLHDAIYSKRRDASKVADAFREVLEELGFEMALQCEG